jgi:NADH-quinone oxidoreductase subunit C
MRSRELQVGMFLKTRVPREDARIESVTSLWPGAEWHEREVYDLFGIVFEGHPDLRRILLPDDWEGHPLRKDYRDDRLIRRPD